MCLFLKLIILLLWILGDVSEINCSCVENIDRETQELEYCGSDYCELYNPIISKNIICQKISANTLQFHKENIMSYDEHYSYPLSIKVIESEIPILPAGTFRNLKNVTSLILEDIKLKKIFPSAFSSLDRVREIYLRNNELSIISDGIFNSLYELKRLDLSKNRIETITDQAFAGISLEYLNLDSNRISMLSYDLLNSLKHLSTFIMSNNNLTNVDDGFNSLKLNILNLSYNNIEYVNFENLSFGQPPWQSPVLDISFNNITEIKIFNSITVTKLFISHNRITEFLKNDDVTVLDISHNDVKYIGGELFNLELVELYAGFNMISSISADAFFDLNQLKYLDLNNNNLSFIPNSCFKDLISLTHLNLSSNGLTQFKFGTFDNLVDLLVLDISNNKFKELPQYALHSLNHLTYFSIKNNEVSGINTGDLVRHLSNLKTIDLRSNVWSCKKLLNIIHDLRTSHVSVVNGDCWEESNIHGIKCYDVYQNKNFTKNMSQFDIADSKLNSFFNEDFTKTILYKYFNQDFKNSDFFKYLQKLNQLNNSTKLDSTDYKIIGAMLDKIKVNLTDIFDFKKSDMYSYFNEDFRNSTFFKYLENLNKENSSILNGNETYNEIVNLLKNISSELETLSKRNTSLQTTFEESDVYNYFNRDFKTSNFFKYLESLDTIRMAVKQPINNSAMQKEKLVRSSPANTSSNGIFYVIVVLLLIITCSLAIITYRQIYPIKHTLLKKEEVELI